MTRLLAILLLSIGLAETPREALQRGQQLWEQRLSKSAIAALEVAARDKATAAEALEALGRIYTFKGWQQEAVFPGWHDEPAYRPKALAALRASLKADPSRVSAQEALRTAESFDAADSVPPSKEKSTVAADPAPLFAEAQRLADAGDYDGAIRTADRGAAASDRFVAENLGAYQMPGKAQGFLARGHAQAAAIAGMALFKRGDLPGAVARLEEAERLYQGLDVANQIVLGDVERARGAADRARDHYLNALSLNASPVQRDAALKGLAAVQSTVTTGLDGWLIGELEARREARRATALRSVVNKPLPSLPLKTLEGKPFDQSALKGKVVLLDFFASWCGICKAELPHLKAAFAKYQNNPDVAFVLVSVDEDAKRLDRYLADMKFPFAIARMPIEAAETAMGFDNVPATFYLDPQGIVRYQTNGTEAHGDSPSRVSWYIDQLMAKQ